MAKKKPIVSPLGQWAYPGEVTIIPSNSITMQGVNYPVLGIDNLGNQQVMMPGMDYTFPGDYVTEIPQMGKGGLRQWFAEEWTDVKTGKACGRSGKEKGSRPYPACRPKNRVNETTPKTTSEMSSAEKARFKREKTSGKRIDYNHKRRQDGGENWLDSYQDGGLYAVGSYDEIFAPKQGNYLLPDINRPSYIDEFGGRRSEYKMGVNIDGKEILIPTVVGGRQLSEDQAVDHYRHTGLHMGQFDTPEQSEYASRLRTARYNMLEDPIRFQADQFQRGGTLPPIYTSNINDPRIGRYNDSLILYGHNKKLLSKYMLYPGEYVNSTSKPTGQNIIRAVKTRNNIKPIRWDNYNTGQGYDENFPEYSIPKFKKPVQPYIYKPELVTPPVESITPPVEPPKPSLAISNIDRDMYTPGGGMAREYNIGVTLQDGSKKSFRTEKEYQDWKAANNLDISNAKVTEGKGYSYDYYPENKKYGGWLDQFQTGGYKYIPPSQRALTFQSSNPSTTDNTRANIIDPAVKKAAEAAQYARRVGSISQGTSKSNYQKAKEASSFVSQAEQRKGSADPLDYVLDVINPATYGFAASDLVGNTAMGVNNLAKGNFSEAADNALNAGMNALYLLPAKGIAKTIASPIAFRPAEGMMYRGLGEEGFKDAIQSGVFRPKQLNYPPGRSLAEKVTTPKQFGSTYYAPAKNFKTVENYGSDYIAEVPFEGNQFARRYGRKDWSWSTPKQIPIDEGRILQKDWLRGYKSVEVPTQSQMSITPPVGGHIKNITKELVGSLRNKGNKAAIAEGNAWLKNWIDDPITQAKIDADLGWIPQRGNILKDRFDLGYEQAKNFVPNTKQYPISNQIQDLGESLFLKNPNPHIHSGNQGVSYLYGMSPDVRRILEKTNNNPRSGSWVTRDITVPQNKRASITTHEGTHDWTSDFLLNESGQTKDIQNILSQDVQPLSNQFNKLKNQGFSHNDIFKIMGKENAYKGYYGTPTEMHARIMQLRKALNMTPEQSKNVTLGQAKNIMKIIDDASDQTFVDPKFLNVIDRDPQKLAYLFNRLWAVPPTAVAASQLQENKYGGWLDSYQDGGENLPELNSKIDIANFYKNPLSEKYGIYQDPEDKSYKYYLKSGEQSQILEQGLDLSGLDKQKLKEINAKKASLSEIQLSNIQPVSSIILPSQRDRILRDKLYNEQDDLMEELSNEIPIIPPSYKEVLENIPKIEDSKQPVKKYNTLPNKQKPVKAQLNRNIELNPVQKFYADRMYEKYGKVILTDKANNRTIYGTKKDDGTWDLNSFEVLTGQNPNFNNISGLSVNDLAKFKDKRGTPIGLFNLKYDDNLYGYPGLRLDGSGNIAYHITYKGPDDLYRSALYNNNNPQDNYRSYGCINCEKPSLQALLNFVKPEDKALIINSNLGFQNNKNWIKKNSPKLYNDLFKDGGWLNKYK